MSFNLATMLYESARSHPDKAAVINGKHALTYAQVDAAADRFAAGLHSHGIEPGDSVGLQLPNLPQFVIAYFGALKAGAVVVPMNVLYKADEVAYILRDAEARMLITWAGVLEQATEGATQAGVKDVVTVTTPGLPEPTTGTSFDALLATELDATEMYQSDPGDTAVIIYTSGTTGRPKGAELTHFQLFLNADTPGRLFGVRDSDVILVVLPLFHIFALSSILDVCVRFAATMTLVPRFDAAAVLATIERDHVTVFEGVPTMYIALLAHPDLDKYDVSSLRVGISGGAPIPATVLDDFEKRFGILILEGYGLSETASTTTFNVSAQDRRVYSVGRPIWGVQVQVWGDDGAVLPAGAENIGELMVRGVNVMRGYRGNPEASAEAFTRGWFHTGDLGYMDQDGYFFVVDRKKELIIRGGYNVYPREVEDAIYTHPAVAQAAVIGVADERLGQEVKAVVALHPGKEVAPEELIDHVKARLAPYKYPRSVEIRAHLPVTSAGKILKREL
ncbi:long-chain-fatty-acid--CoA ligase [Kribbella sindirgiensis]|uniref:Long-chain fatty acid--CoA ligase n=1 Tax=Kribbella sindirgiensis TaxID=1124744 RepID=A0A4R0IG26_9ACTN|nr:long-chain fatty acid--CoA ligase [Kribbella sindirgiensis]TCC32243.1 long-chain fatty acid--CoA ligase [Kribbella sindirgiensis]